MKIFIYVACFFVMIMIQVAAQSAGVLLGAIPMVLLYAGAYWSARGLCKLWDNRNNK